MNKKLLFLCLACANYQLSATYKSENGYEIDVPKNFNRSIIDVFKLNTTTPENVIANVNILTQDLSADMTLDGYIALSKQQYEQMQATILETATIQVSGLPAEKMVVLAGGLKFLHVCLVKGCKAYLLTYTATLNNYEENIAEVEKMVSSWKFE